MLLLGPKLFASPPKQRQKQSGSRLAADSDVVDQFAREMGMRRVDVSRIQAFGNKTAFVPSDGSGSQMGTAMAVGMAAAMGSDPSK